MIGWLLRMWHRRQRKIDLQILWPACKRQAKDMHHAKAAFAVHAFQDKAWTADMTEDEITQAIDALN